MPFDRESVPFWLSTPTSEHDGKLNEYQEIWANFLISRDLLYGLSGSPTNDKSGVEFYNAAQFARQFGLLQLIPLPPHTSLNEKPTKQPSFDLMSLEKVRDGCIEARKGFALKACTEAPEKSGEFDSWWEDHITNHFDKSLKEVLQGIAPPPLPKKRPGFRTETASASSALKRKGKADSSEINPRFERNPLFVFPSN